MAGFVTFGCNIPIFTFAYPADKVFPVAFPGTDLPASKRLKTWWYNFYDRDDVLGYPLAQTSPAYQALSDAKGLRDVSINAGSPFTSWNPLSHNAYWKDDDFYEPVSRLIKAFL